MLGKSQKEAEKDAADNNSDGAKTVENITDKVFEYEAVNQIVVQDVDSFDQLQTSYLINLENEEQRESERVGAVNYQQSR